MMISPASADDAKQSPKEQAAASVINDEANTILAPYFYICGLKGKQIRPILIDAFNLWLKLPKEQLDIVKDIAESLHSASLMVDDIEDHTLIRRGEPATHVKYGEPLTINAANYVYFQALKKCLDLENNRAMKIFSKEMLHLHQGQGMDIYWRDFYLCPTMEQYKLMVSNKTGGLFRLTVGIMQALANDESADIVELVDLLGLFYQIRDDYVNLTSEEYMKTRGSFADDLTEGKFSFPIVHAILFGVQSERLKEILKLRTSDDAVKREAVQIMEESGSLAHTRSVMSDLVEQINNLITSLGGNQILHKIMHSLTW